MSDADILIEAPAPSENYRLKGHEAAEREILTAWGSARMPHAWLITGAKGIGKATFAYRVARYALSGGAGQSAGSLAIDPDHPVCRRIAAGGHADLKVVTRTLNDKGKLRSVISVDDVRVAQSFLSLTAGEGAWRVVIVDCADEMNRNAANALLKFLEEPPRQTLLLLVSHAPGQLLPTIRSRCRNLPLQALEPLVLRDLLGDYLPEMAEDERRALALLADGSPGRAIALAEEGGLALYKEFVALMSKLPNIDARALHRLADRVGGVAGADRFRTLSDLVIWWLGTAIADTARGNEPVEIVPGEGAVRKRLISLPSLDHWTGVWENLGRSFALAQAIDLESSQVLLNAFTTLQRAARA